MKKMRKLIPALAMLLVSAVMMSTASFAWFTMNEAVTATGMQVQAQASGSLVIKADSKLIESDNKISADLSGKGLQSLKPVTYTTGTGWQQPADGATTDIYGVTSALGTATLTSGTNYYDYVVYLAVGGAQLTNQILSAKLEATTNANLYIAPAYSIAFYVGDNAEAISASTTPDAVMNVLNGSTVTQIKTGVTIPSIVGATKTGSTDTSVGVKVVMRVFVDGNLTKAEGTDTTRTVYEEITDVNAKYDSSKTYYVDANGSATVNTTGFDSNTSVTGYYLAKEEPVNMPTKYVNSSNVPVNGTALKVTFSISE